MVASIKLGSFFTSDDIDKVRRIIAEDGSVHAVDRIEQDVVLPQMDHINFETCQDNVPRYFAYVLLHLVWNGGP